MKGQVKTFDHSTRIVRAGNATFPHGLPNEDVSGVFKSRLTFFEIADMDLPLDIWEHFVIKFNNNTNVLIIKPVPEGPILRLKIEFSAKPAPTVQLKRICPVEISENGGLTIGLILNGASNQGLKMKLTLTNEHGTLIANSCFFIRAKITSKNTVSKRTRRRDTDTQQYKAVSPVLMTSDDDADSKSFSLTDLYNFTLAISSDEMTSALDNMTVYQLEEELLSIL
jgi:hypothetical protein